MNIKSNNALCATIGFFNVTKRSNIFEKPMYESSNTSSNIEPSSFSKTALTSGGTLITVT